MPYWAPKKIRQCTLIQQLVLNSIPNLNKVFEGTTIITRVGHGPTYRITPPQHTKSIIINQ